MSKSKLSQETGFVKKMKSDKSSKLYNDIVSVNALYKLWALPSYCADKSFIKNNSEEYELQEKIEILESYDKCYHDRIDTTINYKFFGDCDNYKREMKDFAELLIAFLRNYYNVEIDISDISYTENKSKTGSYHYVIPKLYASVKKLKEIHQNFLTEYIDEFIYVDKENKTRKVVDTTIYSDHWFRCPNQSKEGKSETRHVIMNGSMKDFILEYIEEGSTSIEAKIFLKQHIVEAKPVKNSSVKSSKKEIKTIAIIQPVKETEKELTANEIIKNIEWKPLYRFIDECFNKERFDTYESWHKIGMAIKHKYGDLGFILFRYFSNKSCQPDPEDILLKKYRSFKEDNLQKPITIATFYYFAKEDNKDKFCEIIKTCSLFKEFDMSSVAISKYIKMLRPNHYVWRDNLLYCYNGKYWEQNDLPMRIFIGNELFDFLLDIFTSCFWNIEKKTFDSMKRSLDKLKSLNFKKEIIETTKEEFTNNEIEFDIKWYLFGFKNKVLDLLTGTFRDYKYDDFISITTGYDWIEPKEEEVIEIQQLINCIHPQEKERMLYLEIISTGLEGRCLEKAIFFSGKGGNGKGLIDEIALKAFGNYGITANNAILFEKNKTGTNPEKNNIHKKRFVLFKEPSDKSKLENSVVKELTGGGDFSARGHHESNTQKKLHLTMIIECNKKPLFAEEPQQAEIRRIIDIYFSRIFTDDVNLIDNERGIFLADLKYKDAEYQIGHKCAFIKILLDAYKCYQNRNYTFDIPISVKNRTKAYLEMSCNILTWINDNYEKTNDNKDFVKISDMYNNFKISEHYQNLTKALKLKYNKSYFISEISDNVFMSKYVCERKCINNEEYRNIITNYRVKTEETVECLFDGR